MSGGVRIGKVYAAWQAALAAEQQAAFGYPLLGPHLSGVQAQLAAVCGPAHESLVSGTAAALVAVGQTPVAPAADYPALYPVTDAADARRLAVGLEDDCARAWRFLYLRAASASASLPSVRARAVRATAQANLTASAVRATRWRSAIDLRLATTPFPGT